MSTKITPQLRFPEFTDEWQVKKLGDFSSITTGKLDANAMVENGRYRFYTCAREFYKIDQYAFDTEALLVSGNGANVGYIHYYKGKFNAYQRTYVLDNFRENIGYIKLYLDRYLKKRILQEKFEGNMPYIVLSTLKDMPISTPPTKEQEKIADFLTAVDERIAVGEKKLELLETYKRGVMQQIFSQQIRFKDENGKPYPDWDEKKLGSFIRDFKQSSTIQDEYPVMTSSRKGIILQKDYYGDDNRITERSNVGYNVLPPKYLTYRSRSDDGRFRFNLNTTNATGIVSYFYPVFDIKSGNVKFFEEYLNYNWRILYKYSVGTSQKVLSHTELKNIRFDIPVIEEQQKIANFLAALDEKITAEKSKLTATRQFKKALLQRMFV